MKYFYLLTIILSALASVAKAQTNVIEDQTSWPDGNYSNGNASNPQIFDLPDSSYWCSSKSSQFNGVNGTLVCAPIPAGSSMTWWTYFAPSNNPVTLSPGYTLQMTLNFTVYGTGVQNADRHLRFGLLYSGANQFTNNGTALGTGIDGYAQQMNFGTSFGEAPLQTVADTNLNNAVSIFSKSADFIQIGDNGGGTTNDPAFTDGTNYTLIMSIAENATNSVNITTTIFGSTLTNGMITQTVTDTNYCYTNFDTFVVRPNDGGTTATNFTYSEFKVEIFPTTLAASIGNVSAQFLAPKSIVLTWNSTSGQTYSVLKTGALGTPSWSPIVTGYPVGGAAGGAISYTDTTATVTGFYKISAP